MNLSADDMLEEEIQKFIKLPGRELKIEIHEQLSSTNTFLKEAAGTGEPEGKVVIAREQKEGKGRMGRNFYSPRGTGLYMSLLLRPSFDAREAWKITPAAGTAVARAIEKITGKYAQIKWINDVYYERKKICGILTESALESDGNTIRYAVLGIGINVFTPPSGFPPEIRESVTALYPEGTENKGIRNRLAAEILNQFFYIYENFGNQDFMEEYKKRSFLIGEEVFIIHSDSREEALVIDIDDKGGLVVKTKDNKMKTLNSGEISIRRKGYGNY